MRQRMSRRIACVVLACAALTGCGVLTTPPTQEDVDRFARSFLDSIQADSIAESREYCGYFFLNGNQLQATRPARGREAQCTRSARPFNVIASYHTHGSYGAAFDNEVPSPTDLVNTRDAGIDDYVSTPGGRVWRVAGGTGNAEQLCGLGCITTDPNFVPTNEEGVAQTYTISTVQTRQLR